MTRLPLFLQDASFGNPSADLQPYASSRSWSQSIKRLLDVAGALLGLLFLAPFLGLIALWIALDTPGGAFYRQPRLGRNGKVFNLIKLRTMYANSEQVLEQELRLDPGLRIEWQHYQKLREDWRVTPAGRLLRRFSLDELPQLWNVLKGEMSLVGPRPILVSQCDLYGRPYAEYVQVLPGITGLWQVSGRNATTFARRVELDREYIAAWSLWRDLRILLQTVPVILWEREGY